jgi:hypothetical protein
LKEFTDSTAVYIGKHVYPLKHVKDEDNDTAHLNETADKIIKFAYATKGHEYIAEEIMFNKQGVTFDIFKDKVVEDPVDMPEDQEGVKAPVVD